MTIPGQRANLDSNFKSNKIAIGINSKKVALNWKGIMGLNDSLFLGEAGLHHHGT